MNFLGPMVFGVIVLLSIVPVAVWVVRLARRGSRGWALVIAIMEVLAIGLLVGLVFLLGSCC